MPNANKAKYYVDIEGTIHPWERPTITTGEIASLGGWDLSLGVIEIDKENNERTLESGEEVELKPGQGFSKKIRWKRGGPLSERIRSELELLREQFPSLEYVAPTQWLRFSEFKLPPGWNRTETEVALQIPPAYPGAPPYGIYVPAGLLFRDQKPKNYAEPAANKPPYDGVWGVFSWTPSDGGWRATADVRRGANLLGYVLGFGLRFDEGA